MNLQKSALGAFRQHMLSSPDILPSERNAWAGHKNTHEESLLLAAISNCKTRKNALEAEAEGLELRLKPARLGRTAAEMALSKAKSKSDGISDELFTSRAELSGILERLEKIRVAASGLAEGVAELQSIALDLSSVIDDPLLEKMADPPLIASLKSVSHYDDYQRLALECKSTHMFMSNVCDATIELVSTIESIIDVSDKLARLGEGMPREVQLSIIQNPSSTKENLAIAKDGVRMTCKIIEERISSMRSFMVPISKTAGAFSRIGPWDKGFWETHRACNSLFIGTTRGLISQLTELGGASKDMWAVLARHSKASLAFSECVASYEEASGALSRLPSLDADETRLGRLKQQISRLAGAESRLSSELSAIKGARRQKEARRKQHIQNRLTREKWEAEMNAPKDAPRAAPFFAAAKSPESSASENTRESRTKAFILSACGLFEDSFKRNKNMMNVQFIPTMRALADVYLENEHGLTRRALLEKFPKRAKGEVLVGVPNKSDYDLVRVGLSSTKEYRLLVDVKNSRMPLIYFVGHKGDCEGVMGDLPRNLASFREKALLNGTSELFPPLLG